MKAFFNQSTSEHFFHRYLVDSKQLNLKKNRKFNNEQELSFSINEFTNNKTSFHKCRLVRIGQQNLEEWPLYFLKRISYINDIKDKKNKIYKIYDQNVKKIQQLRTQYLCYKILNKSHRAVRMIEMINQNPKKQEDTRFFYKFLARKKEPGVFNICFVLEPCNDGNLEDRIQDTQNLLDQNSIITYCCQILEGLLDIKKKGILHRDLRPCNIFLHNNEIKFGDFDSAFIYKQSECSSIKNGIDINTTPQQIVELASLSDEELQKIGNFKLYEMQSKCDIYFFGMIIFKMIFKIDYQKKFEGTDLDYLIREKIKHDFSRPQLLELMKNCLYANVEKRIDLVTLFEQFKRIEKHQYYANEKTQRTYLSEDPLDLFSYRTQNPVQQQIMTQIQNSVNHTFTISFVSVQYNFESDYQKATLNRSTRLYQDQANRVLSKYNKNNPSRKLWQISPRIRKQSDLFLKLMEKFVIKMSIRAYFYDYLYRVILKINTKQIMKKQQKDIAVQNKAIIEKELIIILKFIFQILGRTPFKIDKHYSESEFLYETRKLFKDKVKITDKYNFYADRAKTFNFQQYQTYKMINQFYSIQYQQKDTGKFQIIFENVMNLINCIDKKLKHLLMVSIIDLFRPYDNCKLLKKCNLKQILFIMVVLEKIKIQDLKKNTIVLIKNQLEPLFNQITLLDFDQAQMFFDSYKKLHSAEVQKSKNKENIQISFNLLGLSKKHVDCLSAFMLVNDEKSQRLKVSFIMDEYKIQREKKQIKFMGRQKRKIATQKSNLCINLQSDDINDFSEAGFSIMT